MARDINFYHSLNSPATELPVEFADCIQVQNVSGRTIEVIDDVFATPLSTFLVNEDNERVKNLVGKKMLKVRPFTTSANALGIEKPAEPKKKRGKKGQSTSSPRPLEGAVADLAAVINAEPNAVPADEENMEQLVETNSSEDIKSADESAVEGSPETDSQSV